MIHRFAPQRRSAARFSSAPRASAETARPAAAAGRSDAARGCACGGGCPACAGGLRRIQTKTRLGQPDDPQEREADRLASFYPSAAPGAPARGPERAPAPGDLPGPVREAVSGAGRPLEPAARGEMERRLGADFGAVRVHDDAAAAATARAFDARAYTIGADIVFDRGEYRPGAAAGRELIAHELVHTMQQSGGAPAMQRDTPGSAPAEDAAARPTIPLPGGQTLFPGPARLYDIKGAKIPLPGSLRLTNSLGAGPGPSYVLDLSPEQFVLSLLGRVDLSVSDTPGAAPGTKDPNQKASVSLVRPILRLDPQSGRLRGSAKLLAPTGYPLTHSTPTELDVQIESTELGKFTGVVGYGPLHADMTLRLHYGTDRLEQAARPVFAPAGGFSGFSTRLAAILRAQVPGVRLSGVLDTLESLARSAAKGSLRAGPFAEQVIALVASSIPAGADLEGLRKALGDFAQELSHPGFTLRGSLGLGPLPLSSFRAEAPTTLPLASPLLGAPTDFPLTYSAGGVVLAPPGSITDISVPAFGYAYSSFGAKSGTTFTSALLPTLSPSAISDPGRSFNEKFPVYAFAELSHVRRVSKTVDIGVRVTAQFSTPDLTGRAPEASGDVNTLIQENAKKYQQGGDEKPPTPNFGVTLYGRF